MCIRDSVYVFNRGEHPMVVFDREGNFITSWGEGVFSRAHGLHIDADDNLYCTDDGVNITVGLPVVRVSVDHGTAFDIAGRGIAREASLVLSLERAATLAPGWDHVWRTARGMSEGAA